MRARSILVLLTAAATVAVTAGPAEAATPRTTVTQDPVQAAAGWLTTQFANSSPLPAPDGDHIASPYGPDYGADADSVFGLAAAKAGGAKVTQIVAHLRTHIDDYADIGKHQGGPYDGAVAKAALVAIVAGGDPTAFGGHDLLKVLTDDQCTAATAPAPPVGETPACVATGAPRNIYSSVSAAFVVLARARAQAPSPELLEYVQSLQCHDGGFTALIDPCGSGSSDPDATAYLIEALSAAGENNTAVGNAVRWLAKQRAAAGYWTSQGIPNANTTGVAAAALARQGVDVSSSRQWLRAQQVAAGSPGAGAIRYGGKFIATTKSAASPSVRATAQALTGLVDGGSLATVTATGATEGMSLFAPATGGARTIVRGHSMTATSHGFEAGEHVSVILHSAAITVGGTTAGPDGTAAVRFAVPAAVSAGTHTLEVVGSSSGLTATSQLTVTLPPSTSPPAPTMPAAEAAAASAGNGGTLAATGTDGRTTVWLTMLGLAALAAGTSLLAIGRRRTE